MNKYFMALSLLTGCGANLKTSGEITVKHKIDIAGLEEYFQKYCDSLGLNDTETQTCVYTEINKVIALIEGTAKNSK